MAAPRVCVLFDGECSVINRSTTLYHCSSLEAHDGGHISGAVLAQRHDAERGLQQVHRLGRDEGWHVGADTDVLYTQRKQGQQDGDGLR